MALDELYVREMAPVVKAKTGIWVRFKPTTWERGPRQKTRCAWKEEEGQDDSSTFLIKDSWKRHQWGEGQQQSLRAWTAHGRPKHRPQVQRSPQHSLQREKRVSQSMMVKKAGGCFPSHTIC